MTKISLRLLFAALAAIAVLAGCTKEITPGKVDSDPASRAAEGSRVITVSFGPQTKTTLDKDGFTPAFVAYEDIIKVALKDGTAEPEDCVVEDENGVLVIKTNLVGDLVAVYPSSAAKVEDNKITGISVSSTQTGKFADANICCDTIPAGSQSATFVNKTAVLRFYVGSEIEITSVTLESQSEYFGPDIGKKITVNAPAGKTLYDQMPDNQDRRVCYIAVPNGTFSKLTITTTANTQNPKPKQLTNVTFENNKIYSVFIPYYIQVGDQKWAYCNIGAFLPEEPGLYFAWGDTKGYKWDAKAGRFEEGHAFNWENCPFNNGFSYGNTSYLQSVLNENFTKIDDWYYALKPTSDAANLYWGENWHIPTYEEAGKLEKTNPAAENISDNVLTIPGSSLKIPISGKSDSGNPSGLTNATSGYFWKATVYYPNNDLSFLEFAGVVSFTSGGSVNFSSGVERNIGLPIRPIYCDPAPHESDDDSDLLSGKFSVGNKTIMFSKGNLYWDGSSYQFESNQYDYRQFNGIQGDAAVISGISGTTPENTVGTFWWVPNHLVGESTKPYSEAPASNLGSRDDDIIFTNSNGTTANPEFTVNGKSGKYRTFTADEMAAILFDRTDECRFAKAQVMGVNGLFIFPDDYSLPSDYSTEGGVGMSAINNKTKPFPQTNVPNDTWTKMESDGVVFLPAAGYRTSYFFSNIKVNGSGIGGYYWTNSLHGTGYNYEDATAGFMEFTEEDIDQNKNGYRKTGYSVRLVKDVVFY